MKRQLWVSSGLVLLIILTAGCTSQPAMPAVATIQATPALPAATETSSTFHWPGKDWNTALPEEHGFDPKKLSVLLDVIPTEAPQVTSVLVIRDGDIVLEKYFGSRKPETAREIYSCTKSFTATLIGIAFDQGAIPDLQRKVVDYFPDYQPANPGNGKEDMTVEDLLTMSSGFEWTEGDPAYRALYMSSDWSKFMLDLPMREPPGNHFNYCSGCSHLLSAIVAKAAGKNILEFARQYLFDPIGMGEFSWTLGSQGIPSGGWGLQLTSRQMARLGYLYLRNGVWENRQIVSAAWVKASVTAHVQANEQSGYGYQWWVRPSIHGYAALGMGGQMIAVIPEKDLVVVFTADNADHDLEFKLIKEQILPAIQ